MTLPLQRVALSLSSTPGLTPRWLCAIFSAVSHDDSSPVPPLYLRDVEEHIGDDNYSKAIEMLKLAGQQYPQILHLFSFKMAATIHLERFTQQIMREPGPLTPGFRELIAAYTSQLNSCPF